MPIDIDQMTESDLIDLNHRIVARLRSSRIAADRLTAGLLDSPATS